MNEPLKIDPVKFFIIATILTVLNELFWLIVDK